MANDTGLILVVEDDENDVFFLKHAFASEGLSNPLQVVWDGQQAIDYLGGHHQYADRSKFPLPCLVLLDLKLPLKTGLEVLQWVRSQPALAKILTVVLSSSVSERDVASALEYGARSFLTKPLTMDDRRHMARMIKEYWLRLNQFSQ
ncbi:MAG TPA: response regulator [Verrucomicrobiae bacterium]|nr:response regulator [Verrucomicrobiae bacterium]